MVRRWVPTGLGLLLGLAPVDAESQQPPGPCTPAAMAAGRYAARRHHWSISTGTASLDRALGAGTLWRVHDYAPVCTPPRRLPGGGYQGTGLSVHSEGRTVLVGTIGPRRIAVMEDPLPAAPAAPFRISGWSVFLTLSGAGPDTPAEALDLGWLILGSLQPQAGIVRDEPAFSAVLARLRPAEAARVALREQLRSLGADTVQCGSATIPGGFRVTLWTSTESRAEAVVPVPFSIRPLPPRELRRVTLRFERIGVVWLESVTTFPLP
jgi:hypothetical protein